MRQTARLVLLFAGPALMAGCAEPSDPMAGLYGNTWEMRAGDELNSFHVNADGSWTGWFGDEGPIKGRWTLGDGQVCFKADGDPEEHCERDVLGKTVGNRWSTVDDGVTFEATIRAGRA